jgi:hypothetical protein
MFPRSHLPPHRHRGSRGQISLVGRRLCVCVHVSMYVFDLSAVGDLCESPCGQSLFFGSS